MKNKINSRRKGHDFEREVVKLFRPYFPYARRGQQGMGAIEPDVTGTDYWVECKCSIKPDVHAAYDQATLDGTFDLGNPLRVPIVVSRKTGSSSILVTLHWETFSEVVLKKNDQDRR